MINETICNTCKFWCRYHGSTEKGQCRRFSPDVMANVDGAAFLGIGGIDTTEKTVWPETNRDQWCGEYESKEQVKIASPIS